MTSSLIELKANAVALTLFTHMCGRRVYRVGKGRMNRRGKNEARRREAVLSCSCTLRCSFD